MVEDFVYLGGLISSTGSSQPDVRRRIGLACDAVRRLAKIWKNKAISKAAKVQSVWNDGVEHILFQLGNMDTYCRNKQTAESFWDGMLEAKRGHQSQPRHYRGYSIKTPGKKTTIFRSLVRMDQHRLLNIALYGRVEEKRVKGRPRKRWLDNVTDDWFRRGWSIVEATHLATDRQRWRTYIRLSQRAPASPWQQEEERRRINHMRFPVDG